MSRRTDTLKKSTVDHKVRKLKKHLTKKMRGKQPQINDADALKKLKELGGNL